MIIGLLHVGVYNFESWVELLGHPLVIPNFLRI